MLRRRVVAAGMREAALAPDWFNRREYSSGRMRLRLNPGLRRSPVRRGLWAHDDFLRLWAGQTVSALGSQVSSLALPLLAATVLKLHAFAFAALSAIEFIPFTLLSLPAGVWVDRLRRRPLLIVSDWGRALALASIPIAYVFGALTVWQLYAVALATGALTVFFDVAYQSYLPSLVRREQLNEGNAKLEVTRSSAQLGGPGLAGILVAALSAPVAVAIDAASFVVSAVSITAIRSPEQHFIEHGERRSMRHEIVEGLRYVLWHPYMRPALIFVTISNFFTNGLFAILILYAVRQLHMTAAELGLTFSLGNAGFVVGAVLAPRISSRLGIGTTLVAAAALGNWGFFLIPAAAGAAPIPVIATALFLFGICAITSNITGISLFQTITPNRLLGRMTASRRFAVFGVIPLGSLTAGALAADFGLHTAIWITAIGASTAFLPMLVSPVRSVRTLADAEAALHARGITTGATVT